MPMKTPPHVGGLIRRTVIDPLGLSVTEAAEILGVTRPALSNLLNGRAALSADMAVRIERAFGPSADHLLRLQVAFDVATARADRANLAIRPFKAA